MRPPGQTPNWRLRWILTVFEIVREGLFRWRSLRYERSVSGVAVCYGGVGAAKVLGVWLRTTDLALGN